MTPENCKNFIGGRMMESATGEWLPVTNPATGEAIARLPISLPGEVESAIAAARSAFADWSRAPVLERSRVLFRFKRELEEQARELAELIVIDNGKTLAEAKGSVQRGIEAVEFATGIASNMAGAAAEEIGRGIDCEMFRQPLGVVAGFTPFNFPVMVPLWMVPIAVACGNTFVLKPSERAPLAAVRLAELFARCGAPPGTFNVVHGAGEVAEAILAHPEVKAVSVVGSSPVARRVYVTAAAAGKRVQALGGAKNALIVLPDADLETSIESIIASVYGCAGQRCLAGSNVLAVGGVAGPLLAGLDAAAEKLRLGSGLDPETTLGPVITERAKERILGIIESGKGAGAKLVRDGRSGKAPGLENGYFIGPTIFDQVAPGMAIAREEIFGPVLNVLRVPDLDAAIAMVNGGPFGNSASIYTSSGAAARRFRQRIEAGMLGINIGVPAPVAFLPFSGWKESFFGDLHAQGKDAIEFYTRRKVVTSRWE